MQILNWEVCESIFSHLHGTVINFCIWVLLVIFHINSLMWPELSTLQSVHPAQHIAKRILYSRKFCKPISNSNLHYPWRYIFQFFLQNKKKITLSTWSCKYFWSSPSSLWSSLCPWTRRTLTNQPTAVVCSALLPPVLPMAKWQNPSTPNSCSDDAVHQLQPPPQPNLPQGENKHSNT